MNVQDAQSALNGVAKYFIIVPMLDELIFFAIGWYRAPAPPLGAKAEHRGGSREEFRRTAAFRGAFDAGRTPTCG